VRDAPGQHVALPPELNPRGRSRSTASGGPPRGARPVGRHRAGRWRHWLSVVAVVTSVAVLLTAGGGWLLFRHYTGNITRKDVFSTLQNGRPAAAPDHAENYLLVGSDTRAGSGDAEFQGTGQDVVTGARSDTTILVHLSAKRDKALLISFPRDSYVAIPSCTDDTGKVHLPSKDKINAAFATGGASCTIKTIESLTQVRIDHYIEVDFAGFKNMVSSLGGVDVCLNKPAKDAMSGLDLPAGVSHVDGDQALAFVRARYALGDGSDLGRIQRQQQFLGAMTRKATSTGLLLRPDHLLPFLNAVTQSVTTDQNLSFDDMRNLALKLKGLDPARVTFVTVPLADDNYTVRGVGSTVLWDQAAAQALFASVRTDDAIPGASPAPTAAPTDLIVPPEQIRVRVLNGSTAAGLATKAVSDLRAVGFGILGTGNADSDHYPDTVVRYGPTRADSAKTLAAAIPGSKLQPDESLGSGLDLVVGASYAGARAVAVSPGTPAPPPGNAPAKPPVTTAAQDPCGG
jgi:LCP family protein required for cell wall assembly